jgi:hypothetical protein
MRMHNIRNVPSGGSNTPLFRYYYLFKIIPLLIAAMSIYLGYRLFILGVSGQASLSVNSKSVSGQLLNAAPGLFFAIGGIVAVIVTVWKGVSITFSEDGEKPGFRGRVQTMMLKRSGDRQEHTREV